MISSRVSTSTWGCIGNQYHPYPTQNHGREDNENEKYITYIHAIEKIFSDIIGVISENVASQNNQLAVPKS